MVAGYALDRRNLVAGLDLNQRPQGYEHGGAASSPDAIVRLKARRLKFWKHETQTSVRKAVFSPALSAIYRQIESVVRRPALGPSPCLAPLLRVWRVSSAHAFRLSPVAFPDAFVPSGAFGR